MLLRVLFIVGFGISLVILIGWLASYTAESRNENGVDNWSIPGLFRWISRDTTVSAYARQVQQHAQENDAHAARLMADQKESEVEQIETETIARTEVPKGY